MDTIIPLTGSRGRGLFVRIDLCHFEQLSRYCWFLATKRGYVARHGRADEPKLVYIHREIMNFPLGMDVDHVNGDHLDNRTENLRVASRSENNANAHKPRERLSLFRGVTWSKVKSRWVAQIDWQGRHYVAGYFLSEKEAARARDGAAIALHGEFAYRNLPDVEPIPFKFPEKQKKTSALKGIGWSKARRKWRAFTTIVGKMKHLGYFETQEEAYEKYLSFISER